MPTVYSGIDEVLTKWGMEDYVPIFQGNYIYLQLYCNINYK